MALPTDENQAADIIVAVLTAVLSAVFTFVYYLYVISRWFFRLGRALYARGQAHYLNGGLAMGAGAPLQAMPVNIPHPAPLRKSLNLVK